MATRFTVEREIEISLIGFFKDQWYGMLSGVGLGFGLCLLLTTVLLHRCK